jgi:lipid-A-disaccharide synthase
MLLMLHYFVQLQYQFLLIQTINAFISWRNLDFMNNRENACSFRKALGILLIAIGFVVFLCFLQILCTSHTAKFLQIPIGILSKSKGEVCLEWHLFGFFGGILFASRFWVQWVQAERKKTSKLTKNFWILSILGSMLALVYFSKIHDWVGVLNYSFGLIPYIRNLMLISKTKVYVKSRG